MISISRKKIKKKLNWKLLFWFFLFFCLILALVYLLIFSPFLKIKNINIKGTEKISQERERTLIWCGEAKCFYLDQEGLAFEEAPEIYGGMILTLKDNSNKEIEIGDKVISPDLISFLLKTNEFLSQELNLSLANFRIDSYPVIDLIAVTSENWQIFFDSSYDSKSQVEALKQVLEEKIKEKRSQIEYIDLRIENRVYYKLRDVINKD